MIVLEYRIVREVFLDGEWWHDWSGTLRDLHQVETLVEMFWQERPENPQENDWGECWYETRTVTQWVG